MTSHLNVTVMTFLNLTILICFLPFSYSFIQSSTSISRFRHEPWQQIVPSRSFLVRNTRDEMNQHSHSHAARSSATSSSLGIGAQEAWTAYNDALQAHPLLVKSVTACVILGAADLAGQALEDFKSGESTDIDYARTARFAFFGLVLQVRRIRSLRLVACM
jgi:hypothetical protein